jgi:inhibitor of KinA sporulation pathway (predicted exonuclease)
MRHDYSFDLETLGTGRDSYILSIGCAKFDIETGEILDTFYSKTRCGDEFKIDFDTVAWWMGQDDQVKKDLFNDAGTIGIKFALQDLINWMCSTGNPKSNKVWGNGATFDISLLEDAFNLRGELVTWEFWNIRDVRTVVDLASIDGFDKKKIEREGVHHNALDDAIHQANLVSEAFEYIRKEESL